MDEALAQRIRLAGVDRVREQIAEHALRSIRVRCAPQNGQQVPGVSRLGGVPDLPEGIEWPRMELVGTPLAFVAQINLAEAAPEALLPQQGMLYFFVDLEEPYGFGPADADRWKVIYSESVPAAGPSQVPEDLPPNDLFGALRLTFEPEWTLPPYESPMVEALGLTTEETDAYFEADGDESIHRLLGHPQQVQGFVPYEVAMAARGLFNAKWESPEAEAARAEYADWILLFQVDSEWEANGMLWGDVGRLYFYIKRQDLLDRRFDKVWLMMQCG